MAAAFEDFFLVFLVEALEQFDGVVGFQFADALGDRFGFEDFLADGVVDFIQGREVEIRAGEFHQSDTVVGFEQGDQIAEIGHMQFRDDRESHARFLRQIHGESRHLRRASGGGRAPAHRPIGQRPYPRPCRALRRFDRIAELV